MLAIYKIIINAVDMNAISKFLMTPFLLVLLIMLWQPVAAQQAPLLSNVNLSDNQGDPIELSQETTTSYKAEVPNAVAQVQVMLTAADPNATITVDNEVIESGRESQFIILAESGVTTITIVVTAEDAMNIYTIAVSRAASSDASLSSLLLTQSNGTLILLAETFAPETTTYTASVKNMIAQVRVMPMASDLNATITVDGRNVFSFNESQPIELAEGEVTTITIVVTAQAGNTNTYTIAVSRQAAPLSSDATLSALTLTDRVNGTSVVGDIDSFSPDKLQYSARVLYIVSTVTVTVSATDIENAEIRVNGAIVASGADIAVPLAEAGASTDIEIVVTAQDRETDNTYTVTVYRVLPPLPRSDATLFDLELVGNGETIDFDFDSMVSTYTVSVAHTVDTIEVIPTANDSFAATIEVNGISVERGDSTEVPLGDVGQSTDIVVIVTAGDGVTMASYTVTVTRELSNDASLSALMLTDTEDNTITLMPAFASMMNNYTAEVANTVAQVRVTPVATEGTMSMISIGNETVASSASISVDLGATGTTTDIEIVVTAPNGMTMNTYTIEVNRAVPPALDDTTLVGLALVENGEPIALDFDSMVSTYTVSVAHTVDNLEVTPTANNSSATIVINGTDATSGESTDVMLGDPGQSTDIVVIVTAADGMTMASYTVTVNRALSNDASLSALMLTDTEDHTIPLMPTFASEETNYTASVGATVAEVRVTPVATGTIATIMVEVAEVQTQVESGSPSNPIPLVAGEVTTITIEVTAQAGNTNTYTIAVNRLAAPPSSDASLSGLTVSAGTLSPDFNSDTQDYTVEVANATATITVTPTATNVNATITVDDEAVVSGSASSAIELAEGEVTTITIVVTAQDGTTNTYTIAVNRAPSSDATLSGLTISAGTLMPTFMSDTLSYTVEVANATPTITVTPVPTNPNATITVNGGSASDPISLAAGEVTTITVVVTAQDDNTMETYTIAVTRLAPPPSSDASLSALEVSAGTLMPPFMSDTLSYTVEVANATPTITVTPTASDANVIEIMVNGERVGSGNASQFIDLAEGDVTEITIVVTAQDSTTNTYTIAVARGGLLPSCTQTIPDTDDDGVLAVLDIDKDGDGLIELCDLEGLNAIRYQLDGSGYRANSTATLIMTGCPSDGDGCRGYELVRSLDFDDARSYGSGRINTAWTKGTGWLPIGSQDQPFNAIFEGNDNTISNLMIDRPADNRIGLFGEIDTNSQISNIGLLDVNIMGNAWVGGLVGNNEGSITNSYTVGSVTGNEVVGGLAGFNQGGSITNSYAASDVTGQEPQAGGLVGQNDGGSRITNSYATGDVKGESILGGLVGYNQGRVMNSYATGDVEGVLSLGGLVGVNDNSITNSYAAGDVTGESNVGDLVGSNRDGTITNSSPQSTKALQAPTTATGIYSGWSTADWDFGSALQYPRIRYATGSDPNNPACGIAGQPSCGVLLPNQIPISSDASLSALVISAGTLNPTFASNEMAYSVSVVNSTQTITVTPSSDANAIEITVNDGIVVSGSPSNAIPLVAGDVTTITIEVTAQDRTTNTYVVTVNRDPSSDASLSALEVSEGSLMPVFMSDTLSYTVGVANATQTITVTPVTTNPNATITVDGRDASESIDLTEGDVTTITVVVTAQDDNTMEAYTIAVTRLAPPLSSDASLSALMVSAGTLMPTFMGDTLSYTVEVANVTPTITVTPTASDANVIEITVNGERVGSGNASQSIALTEGDTTEITIVVTAQDSTTNTYTIAVTRGLLPSCTQTIPDTDDDGVSAVLDIDKDGDGLIELCDLEGLDAIRHQLDGSGYRATSTATLITTGCPSDDDGCHGYELVRSLDFDDAGSYGSGRIDTAWTTSTGWLPIGSQDQPFGAIFEGNDQTISNLTIDRPDEDHIGLFGYTGTSSMISNIGLLDVFIRGNDQVGGLVGHNGQGRITNSYAAGAVTGENIIGGLVGLNFGSITNSYATGEVTGNSGSVGGLVGRNLSSITNSYARGDVRGQDTLGGLVGWNRGVITNSYATGAVTGEIHVGGLAGSNWSSITNSYATGDVTGNQRVGGLVGTSESEERDSIITNSYATGDVDGSRLVGGLVGINAAGYTDQGVNFQSSITNSYATGDVTGESNVDDLVGLNESDIINSSPQSTEALQAPTTATGIYSGWSTADWDFGNSLQYPTLKYAIGPDENNPACDTAGQPNCGALLPNQIPISSDASLSALVISAGTLNPAFASNQVAYSVSVANTTTTVTVTPSSDANAIEITVNGQTVGSGTSSSAIALTEGDFTAITIIVTAQDSTTNTYTIAVGRGLSNDASLSALEVSAGTLMPAFMSDTLSYTVEVANAIDTITVIPTATNANTTITVNDETVGSGSTSNAISLIEGGITTIRVEVTAQDSTTNTYTIAVSRELDPSSTILPSCTQTIPDVDNDGVSAALDIDKDGDGLIELCDLEGLNAIRHQLDGSGYRVNSTATLITTGCPSDGDGCRGYELVQSLDFAEATSYRNGRIDTEWTTGTGWLPIGSRDEPFNAIFEGNGHTISNLMINRPSDIDIGLFGETANNSQIANIGLLDVDITGDSNVGGLVGDSRGSITNSYATGDVTGHREDVGGLVGQNIVGNITNSYATGDVRGVTRTGGLVGFNQGRITNSYATGRVTGDWVGGLVGVNTDGGSITNSYARGDVDGSENVGGLVGLNSGGNITNSYATGDVTGQYRVGGLVGLNNGGSITNSSPQSTAALQAPTTATGIYSQWSTANWNFGSALQYPTLKYAAGSDPNNPACGTAGQPSCGALLPNQIPISSDASLSALTVSAGTLNPAFARNEVTYSVSVANSTQTITVTPSSDANATITVETAEVETQTVESGTTSTAIPLAEGEVTTITVVVTAQDGTINTYTIAVSRLAPLSSDASLSDLTVSAGTLMPVFNSTTLNYTVSVANNIEELTVTPTASDDSATITVETAEVETQTVESGTTSTAIPLAAGEVTMITIVVTAQDGTMKENYTIAVRRLAAPLSNDASLSALEVSAGTLSPDFNRTTLNYTVSVRNDIERLTVTPTASDDSATITVETAEVDTQTVESGTTSTAIELAEGEVTTITIEVTAEDGTPNTYTIAVSREASVSALPSCTRAIPDTDDDNVSAAMDIDKDNDGLIELCSLEGLDAIRYQFEGRGYQASSTADIITTGCPTSGCRGYELVQNLDFMDTDSYDSGIINTAWTTGEGWLPLGKERDGFNAVFEGNYHTISNLMIDRPDNKSIGLFGATGTYGDIGTDSKITNIGLLNAVVTGGGYVGSLVGLNDGSITNSYAIGDVIGDERVGGLVGEHFFGGITNSYAVSDVTGDNGVGGLVGRNQLGGITNSYATGDVDGIENVGGLVGLNQFGGITNSYATGDVTGTGAWIGGLVGRNGSRITNSYAMGDVDGTENVGGLVGENNGIITNSYATGDVTGTGVWIGGLVGEHYFGDITNSYATGDVTGWFAVGGLVGLNQFGGITNSYATGDVDGIENVGGLVGYNDGSITNSYATGDVDGIDNVGGLVGYSGVSITNSYAIGVVSGQFFVGDLVGWNFGDITNSYAAGAVQGNDSVGGLVGDNQGSITNSGSQSTEALQAPTATTGIFSEWSIVNWDFGNSLQYPVLKYTRGPDDNNPACGISGQPDCGALLSSFDANLSDLMVSAGTLSQPFSSDIKDYTVMVANTTRTITVTPTTRYPRATIIVNTETVASGRASSSIALTEGGTTTITIVVTAQDRTTTNTYTIAVNRPLSEIATLSSLTLTDRVGMTLVVIEPNTFDEGTLRYSARVLHTVSTLTVTVSATDDNAKIRARYTEVESGTSFDVALGNPGSATIIEIAVTAQDGMTTRTYTITMNRAAIPEDDDATLFNLALLANDEVLDLDFDSKVTTYAVSVAHRVDTLAVIPTVNNSNATIVVNGREFSSGDSTNVPLEDAGEDTKIVVIVTAADGNTTASYAVTVSRALSNDTSLSALVVSAGTLEPGFNSNILDYTVSVANTTATITVTPTASDANVISITVNGETVDSGSTSTIVLTERGTTTITVVVTAQDGTKNTYTIAVSALPACTQAIPDTDNDDMSAAMDIDKDGDGLIELCSLEGLDAIRHQLDGSGYRASSVATLITTGCPDDGCFGYELVRSLDFENTDSYDSGIINTAWTTGAGWQPIGSADNPFTGNFEANFANNADITISNLTINRPNADYVGLFSVINRFDSRISGIRLLDADIKGRFSVGGIIGSIFSGLLANSSVQGSVEGSDAWVGGLVGLNYGAIINGYAQGSAKGDTSVGGLAGYSLGPISNSYAAVDVEAKAYSGGLVGYNHHREDLNFGGRITNSYATGSVQSGFSVGGLVGYNSGGLITDVYASGNVVGSVNVGGLVGYNAANGRINGRIENGYALGVVSGGVSVGGLVGYNDSNATIINSYWDSDESGIDISAGGTSQTSEELRSSSSTKTVYVDWSADNWGFGSQDSPKYPTLKYRLDTDINGNQICGADVLLPDCFTALPEQGQPGSIGQLALTTLTLSAGVLEPPFDPTQTYYEILDIPAEQMDVTIAATINNNQATIIIDTQPSEQVTISRDDIGANPDTGIQIVLTATDQSTQQYTIVLPPQPVLTGPATLPCREDDIDRDDDGLIEICDIEGLYAMRYQLDGTGYAKSLGGDKITAGCDADGTMQCRGYELAGDLDFNNPNHYRESSNQAIWTVADYVDMTDRGWRPIGHPTRPFNAIFTGNGYTISNLAINRDDSDYVGLFGNTTIDAEIASVGLSDVTMRGRSLVGGLVGQNNDGTIEHSYVSGDVLGRDILAGGLVGWHGGRINNSYVMGIVSGNREVGGLVGTSYSIDNNSTSTIINSYALSNVQGRTFVGGLIGLNVGLTSNSYASGEVNGIFDVGGLTGTNAGIIENSYASGSVSGDVVVGGLASQNRMLVSNSYASGAVSGNRFVGGLLGVNNGSIVASYWDRETSGIDTSAGGFGLTTDELQISDVFAGWSSEQWDVAAGRYPALKYTAGDDNENPTCDNEVETDLPPCGVVLPAQAVSLSALPSCAQTIADTDNDGITATMDIDKDGDGLIELCSLEGLDAIRYQLDGRGYRASSTATLLTTGCPDDGCFGYELVRSLDFENTDSYDSGIINTAWTTGAGWQPIGSTNNPFTGNFVANFANNADITISNLTINRPNTDYVGLFSVINRFDSRISGIRLLDADIKGRFSVGGIIGSTFNGLLANSSVQGSVEGSDAWVGGLVGLNYGAIINGYAVGNVKGHTSVGGLAGYSLGPISNSYASVDVEAKAYSGGLVGYNHHRINYGGRITNSYATGSVQSGFGVGGLVGYNNGGLITDVYASGNVVGSVNVGGLVGYNDANGWIENGYALGVVSGGVSVGGLVGYSDSNAAIINSYWDSDVSGIDISAGGTSRTSVELVSSTSTATVYVDWSTNNWDFGSQDSPKYPTLKYRLNTDIYGNQICGADVSLPDCGTALPDQGQPGSLGQLALTTLTLSAGVLEPPFDPTQTYYEILDIPAEQADVTIAATINNNQATITINTQTTQPNEQVTISRDDIGSTPETGIDIVLTATGQPTQQYTIVLPVQPVLTGQATSPVLPTQPVLAGQATSPVLPTQPLLTGQATSLCSEDDIDIDNDGLIEICDIEGLYAMRYQLDGTGYTKSMGGDKITAGCDEDDTMECRGYELARDLDFNDSDHYRESSNQAIWTVADYADMTDRGWRPIGHPDHPFTAIFVGNGYTISNLAINRDDSDYVGLFGNTASDAEITSVGLSDVTIQGRSLVGGLVGRNNDGTIEHSYVSGDVLGHDILVGGLVGWHGGRINNSYVMGMVSGNRNVGGLVGNSYSIDNNSTSTIINSYALSNVQGRTFVGGLIGINEGLTSNSYASGEVNGIIDVGGLVSLNEGIIENSYANGSVSGGDVVGGLIGDNRMLVRTSYASGAVSGNRLVGGLLGFSDGGVAVDSYWDRETSGIDTSAGINTNGLTTNQLQASDLFEGWSSENWDVAAGRSPVLKYTAGDDNQNPTCDDEAETDLPPCGVVLSAQIGLLDSLIVSNDMFMLTPSFTRHTFDYDVTVNASVNAIELQATAADSLITIDSGGLAEASTNTIRQTIRLEEGSTTIITIVVTAQDGSATNEYLITVRPVAGIRVRVKVFLEGPLR